MPILEICDRCGCVIKDGEVRFKIRILAGADDGGMEAEAITDCEIENLISELETIDSFELESQIFEERVYVLCSACKTDFLKQPFGFSPDGPLGRDNIRVFH
ncbi:hypothetical protein MNBD_NITROSPINAE02-1551 [hydrothermal vent metagenome]|uniref:Uncharacterized protein n=1 Tax=hydrothermal vent metagenome TaxID=652676 RepID=A0A3B1BQL7_9ZZZZ